MAITWTKKWTDDDNGAVLTGGDIGQLQDDISDAFNFSAGTGANQLVQLDALARLPAVDASQLTGITATQVGAIPSATWTDYSATSTIVGWSSFIYKQIYYKVLGSLVFVAFELSGTSNATSISFTLPYASKAAPGQIGGAWNQAGDNGVALTTAGCFYMPAGGSLVYCYKDMNVSTWTNTNAKYVIGQFFYEKA